MGLMKRFCSMEWQIKLFRLERENPARVISVTVASIE